MDVEPVQFDVTVDVDLSGSANTLQYYGLSYANPGMKGNGTQDGCQGSILMSSYFVYY
jgi:hypothetical protein